MLWSPRLSLSDFHVRLTVKGLFRNLQLLPGCRKNAAVLHAVDRKRPREAPPRAAAAAGQPPELVPDAVMANAPPVPVPAAVPVLPAPADATRTRAGPRASPKTGPRPQRPSRLGGGGAPGPTAVDGSAAAKRNQNKEEVERRSRAVSQLRRLLLQGNRRVEALATVIQHLLHTREEALRQKKEASLQLEELRQELARSARRCQRLQEEGEEERRGSEEAVRRLQEEHREELAQLEDRLRRFYQTEWDRVQQVYQEEAERCRRLVEQQVEELRSRQEVQRRNQEVSHSQEVESLRRQHEASVEELKKLQQVELEELRRTLKETETALMEQLSALSAEKEELNQQLRSEEERRQRLLADRTLDPHTIYLEQELESLKVVLEIKSNQLHQKDKKLVEMDKLVETKVKLEEQLKKVQQENEDYRARMDKHAALSKQLSSEQAALQQTLQQESKVNKRLSMENEELLWRLHHAHLLDGPAHRHSPTSAFGSPRNSASFPSAAPLSPR